MGFPTRTPWIVAASLAVAFLQTPSTALAGDPRTVLIERFDPAPDGSGGSDTLFDGFDDGFLNDAGEVAFQADLVNGYDGLYRTDGATTVQIARRADPVPTGGGGEFFTHFLNVPFAINDAGEIAFLAEFQDAGGTFIGQGLWVGDGSGLVEVARWGDAAPDGNGTFDDLGQFRFNDRGQVAFEGSLEGTAGGLDDDNGIFLGDGNDLVQVAREGYAAPGPGDPTFSSFSSLQINEVGQVVFKAGLDDDLSGNGALFIADATSASQIVHEYAQAPGGGEFESFSEITNLNEQGQAAWQSDLRDTPDPKGIFRGSANGLTEIARVNDPAPDATGASDGVFSDFDGAVYVNNDGEVIFKADISGSATGFRGVFVGDGTSVTSIVREGDPAPDGNGSFSNPALYGINEQGQVLFTATLSGTAGGTDDDYGVFLYDDIAGLLTAAREGGPLGLYTHEAIYADLGFHPEERTGFNEFGHAAYAYRTTTGGTGIAVFDGGLGGDPVGPDLSVDFTPIPITAGEPGTLTATADDTRFGGSDVSAIEYRLSDGSWLALPAADGAYDSPVETGTVSVTFTAAGVHDLCARATDDAGAVGLVECVEVQVDAPDPTVRLRAIEVNQAIQDWRNSIPLYHDKPTVVRVFLETIDGSSPAIATGVLHGSVGSVQLDGSPLEPEKEWVDVVPDATVVDDPDTDHTNEQVRGLIDSSLNFVLPASWTNPTAQTVELEFEITGPGDQVLGCEEPDGTPDCTASVRFEDANRPLIEFLAVPYNRNEIRELRVNATGGTFVLESGGNVSDPLPFDAAAEEVDDAVEDVLGARDGRVDVRGPAYTITILRGQSEDLTVDGSGLSGSPASATMTVIQAGGPEIRPTDDHLREEARRVSDVIPASSVDRRLGDLNGFNRAPTVIKVNTRMARSRVIAAVTRNNYVFNSKTFGYLLGNVLPGPTRSGQAWVKEVTVYALGDEEPDTGGRWRNLGGHEASHAIGRAHAVTFTDPTGLFRSGVCGSHGHLHTPTLHPWVEDTGWDNRLVTDNYSDTTWPTIGPLSDGPDDEVWGFSPRAYANGFDHLVVVDPWQTAAMMSYCDPDGARQDLWPSTLTYDVLHQRLNGEASDPPGGEGTLPDGEYVVVTGTIDPVTGDAVLDPVLRMTGSDPGIEPGDVHVALVDGSGAELTARDVLLLEDGNDPSLAYGEGPLGQGFVAALRVPDGTTPAGVEVTMDSVQVGSMTGSSNPPAVAVTAPAGGTVVTDPIAVEWTASDADGDPLTATVMYSIDGGTTWETLAVDHEGTSYDAPTRFLRGSTQARIRVQVSDGFHTADDVSGLFTVDAGDPLASIEVPAGSHRFVCDGPLRLRGDGWDPEDGMLSGGSLEWTSDVDGLLGTGKNLTLDLDALTFGWHVVTLTATDSGDRSGTDTVDVYVGPAGCAGAIFADGFASGDLTAWSTSMP